jgi:isoquinoline 1-oxidoreductase subunit beta
MISLSSHGLRSSSDPSRRSFLITMLGARVMLGYAKSTLGAADVMLEALSTSSARSAGDLFEPTIWYGIDPSGTVTVNIIRAEMGQHVGTALARIVADELEVDWRKLKIVTVDSDPKWGIMVTGGSWSVDQVRRMRHRRSLSRRGGVLYLPVHILNLPNCGTHL